MPQNYTHVFKFFTRFEPEPCRKPQTVRMKNFVNDGMKTGFEPKLFFQFPN